MNYTSTTGIVQSTTPMPGQVPPGSGLARKVISSLAISVLIILTLFGNTLVIAAFYRYRRVRNSVTNWFILSLAISDLLVACLSEPFWLSIEITEWENFPEDFNVNVFFKFWVMLDIVCAVSSIVNLMLISIDRYFAIKSPLLHHTKMGPETARWIIPSLWGYAMLTSCIAIPTGWYWNTLTLFITGFLIPLLVMVVCYGGILHVVVSKGRSGTAGGRVGRRMNREFKTAKSLGVVTGAFVICWLPFHIVSLAYRYCPKCGPQIDSLRSVQSAVKWLHYLNSCLNPIIYAFLNPTFKLAFKNLFKLCLRKQPETFDESSFSWSFRRRGTKSSISSFRKRSCDDGKSNGQLPNGKASPRNKLNNLLHTKRGENGNESSSSEEDTAVKKSSDANSVQEMFGNTFLEGKDASQPLLGFGNTSPGYQSVVPGNSPKQQHPEGGTWPLPQRVSKRSVSFTDHQGFLRNGLCVPEKQDFVESPLFQGELSTFLDQAKNKYYFLVDGIMVPDEDIKCSDV